jgi:hypothetical protein
MSEHKNWKLREVLPNKELSESYFTLDEAMELGYSIVYETEESMFLLSPRLTVKAYIIDKQ